MPSAVAVGRLGPRERRELESLACELGDRVYARDCYRWLCDQVLTLDEATQSVRPWPDKGYIKDLVDLLQSERLVAIPKSRRMLVSWTVACWVLHQIRYRENVAAFWQALKEEHAAFVVDRRIKWVEDHLRFPPLRRPYDSYKTKGGLVGKLIFKNGSYVQGVPEGAHSLRSMTASIVVMDECEFQPQAREAYRALIPLVEHGKNVKLVMISSANGPNGVLASICREAGFTRFTQTGG